MKRFIILLLFLGAVAGLVLPNVAQIMSVAERAFLSVATAHQSVSKCESGERGDMGIITIVALGFTDLDKYVWEMAGISLTDLTILRSGNVVTYTKTDDSTYQLKFPLSSGFCNKHWPPGGPAGGGELNSPPSGSADATSALQMLGWGLVGIIVFYVGGSILQRKPLGF